MPMASQFQFQRCFKSPALRSYAAEFISTFVFVFVVVGSAISPGTPTLDVTAGVFPLVAAALAQGFALFTAVYVATEASGGHVNPAVMFGMAVCGRIAVPTAILYCIVQMVAATCT